MNQMTNEVGDFVVKPKDYNQQEMFPKDFHENYVVISHHYMIGEDGKSYWSDSSITWRTNDPRRDN